MTLEECDRKHNVEVLCTSYSLDELKEQREKLADGGAVPRNMKPDDRINAEYEALYVMTPEELNMAIDSYDNEEYRLVREEVEKIIKSLPPKTYHEYDLVLRKRLTDHYNFPIP